ncbi:MAG: hypothetical protein JSW39_14885 [Desulfobacterales bacterium]|nr:MAG: hypothetical protein JSW39_14885 [Desulfobacterales bacterium]
MRLKVVEVKSPNRALVDFGKFRAQAEIKFPVAPGEEFVVKVVETGRQLKLSLVNPDSKNDSAGNDIFDPGQKLPAKIPLNPQSEIQPVLENAVRLALQEKVPPDLILALNRLNAHFEPLNVGGDLLKLIARLKALLEDSGLLYEQKIKRLLITLPEAGASQNGSEYPAIKKVAAEDLKSSLLILKGYLDQAERTAGMMDAKNLARLKNITDILLRAIADQQNRAVANRSHPEPFQVFDVALPLMDSRQRAGLKIYYPKKSIRVNSKGFRISLLLTMDRLGEIRTDFVVLEKNLTITFFVKNAETQKVVEANFPVLTPQLNHHFNNLMLRAVVSENKILEFDREDRSLAGDRRVDLRV